MHQRHAFFKRWDLQTIVLSFLRLPWDEWRYLIHQSRKSYWEYILSRTSVLSNPISRFSKAKSGLFNNAVQRHKADISSRSLPTDSESLSALEDYEPKMEQVTVCVLLITTEPFMAAVVASLNSQSSSVTENETSDLTIDIARGEARWGNEQIFEFDGDIFENYVQELQNHLDLRQLCTAAMTVVVRC
jgi:hypothetical protein